METLKSMRLLSKLNYTLRNILLFVNIKNPYIAFKFIASQYSKQFRMTIKSQKILGIFHLSGDVF